jgi:hypothetical protein
MMRKLFLSAVTALTVVALAAGSAQAVDMKGKWGPGVSFEDIPLDAKFGVSPKSSVFVGIGFRDTNIEGADADIGIGGGFEYALFGGDDYNFNFQPSIQFFTGNQDMFRIPLALAAEVWMNDKVSVSMSHGIVISSVSGDDDLGTEDETNIGTFAGSVTAFRFRFWVK